MKRTPLKRGTKPLQRGKRPNAKRKGPARRVSVVRDRTHLEELRLNFCDIGLRHGSECCSMVMDAAHGSVNGMGSKGGDDGALSLCRSHHREQHQIGWPAFEAKYKIDRAALAAEHYERFKQEQSKCTITQD